MEKARFGTVLSSRCTSVDFPEPEGAEMMNTVVTPGMSFKIQRLFADLFDGGLGCKRQFRHPQTKIAQPAGLRKDGIGLAVQFLQQKIQTFADFASRIEYLVQLPRM